MSNDTVTAKFGGTTYEVRNVSYKSYIDGTAAIMCDLFDADFDSFVPEVISTNLSAWGIHPAPGNAFIKDYSEHEGLAESLVGAGVLDIVGEVTFGPYDLRAYEVRLVGGR